MPRADYKPISVFSNGIKIEAKLTKIDFTFNNFLFIFTVFFALIYNGLSPTFKKKP